MIDPPAIYNELGQILVCEPTRPHMRKFHVAHRAVHTLPPRPTLRAHPHRHRVCHAHVRCHWEDVLGGPAGAWPSQDGLPQLDAGSDLGSYGDFGGGFFSGGDFGGGGGTFVRLPHERRLLQLVAAVTPVIPLPEPDTPETIPPIELAPPPIQAIPEPASYILFAIGMGAIGFGRAITLVMRFRNQKAVE